MENAWVATEDCPVCLDPIKMGLITSCGHKFCGGCILKVWRTSARSCRCPVWPVHSAAISCPMCRQKVMEMVPYLTEEERNTKERRKVEIRSRILEEAAKYKRALQIQASLSLSPSVKEVFENFDINQWLQRYQRDIQLQLSTAVLEVREADGRLLNPSFGENFEDSDLNMELNFNMDI